VTHEPPTGRRGSRKYDPDHGFLRIRDFLQETTRVFGRPLNWGIARWEYARYFIAPYLGGYGETEGSREGSLKAIRFWEEVIRVWENEEKEIVGVVNLEHPNPDHLGFGEIFVQRHPRYPHLLDEMLDYGEAALVNPKTNSTHIYVYDYDVDLQRVVERRGYEKDPSRFDLASEYVILDAVDIPGPDLPEGFILRSMADENDIERCREIFGRGFNHPDPSE